MEELRQLEALPGEKENRAKETSIGAFYEMHPVDQRPPWDDFFGKEVVRLQNSIESMEEGLRNHQDFLKSCVEDQRDWYEFINRGSPGRRQPH